MDPGRLQAQMTRGPAKQAIDGGGTSCQPPRRLPWSYHLWREWEGKTSGVSVGMRVCDRPDMQAGWLLCLAPEVLCTDTPASATLLNSHLKYPWQKTKLVHKYRPT